MTLREKCSDSEFYWSVFSLIRAEYGEFLRISQYTVWMRKSKDQKNSEYEHLSRSKKRLALIFLAIKIYQENGELATSVYRKDTFSGVYKSLTSFISLEYSFVYHTTFFIGAFA